MTTSAPPKAPPKRKPPQLPYIGLNLAECVVDMVQEPPLVNIKEIERIYANPGQAVGSNTFDMMIKDMLAPQIEAWKKRVPPVDVDALTQMAIQLVKANKVVPFDANAIHPNPALNVAKGDCWTLGASKDRVNLRNPAAPIIPALLPSTVRYMKPAASAAKASVTVKYPPKALAHKDAITGMQLSVCVQDIIKYNIPNVLIEKVWSNSLNGLNPRKGKVFTREEIQDMFSRYYDKWSGQYEACIDKVLELANAGKIYEPEMAGEKYSSADGKYWRRNDTGRRMERRANEQELTNFLQEIGAKVEVKSTAKPAGVAVSPKPTGWRRS